MSVTQQSFDNVGVGFRSSTQPTPTPTPVLVFSLNPSVLAVK
ncbi:hypothetical protein [uncultured Nostoc sp.]